MNCHLITSVPGLIQLSVSQRLKFFFYIRCDWNPSFLTFFLFGSTFGLTWAMTVVYDFLKTYQLLSFYNSHILCVDSFRSPRGSGKWIRTVQLVTDNVKHHFLGNIWRHQFIIYQLDVYLLARATSQLLKSSILCACLWAA